jgi:hypothetical protein
MVFHDDMAHRGAIRDHGGVQRLLMFETTLLFIMGWLFGMITAYFLWEGKTGFFEWITFMLRKRDVNPKAKEWKNE